MNSTNTRVRRHITSASRTAMVETSYQTVSIGRVLPLIPLMETCFSNMCAAMAPDWIQCEAYGAEHCSSHTIPESSVSPNAGKTIQIFSS